jgi:hypothetical protein
MDDWRLEKVSAWDIKFGLNKIGVRIMASIIKYFKASFF